MSRNIRIFALTLIVALLALQMHVWVEGSGSQVSGHLCQLCATSGWAVVTAALELPRVTLSEPAQRQPELAAAHLFSIAVNASRAPPAL